MRSRIIGQIQLLEHDVHNRRRPYRHGLQQRLGIRIDNGIIRADIPGDKLLHHIGHRQIFGKEFLQIRIIFELKGIAGTNAHIRLDDYRVIHYRDKLPRRFNVRDFMQTRRRHTRLGIKLLHGGLILDAGNIFILVTRGHMKIRAQTGILLQPEFVIGLNPVNLPVLKGKIRHRAVHLVIVRQVRHEIVFRQSLFQLVVQCVVGHVPDSEYVHAAPVQAVAELRAGDGVCR